MPIIPLTCPFCGGDLQIDSNLEAAVCKFCKKPFVVKDAIVQNYISNVTNINAENVNIYTQKDFVIEAGVLKEYKGESVDVVIPDNVKTIGWRAFAGKEIERVTISDSVLEIFDKAFEGCRRLASVALGKSVETIGQSAFAYCTSLKKITVPSNVKLIRFAAFDHCSNLEEVTIEDGIQTIESSVFVFCEKLTSISIPNSVKEIGGGVFYNCTNLREVVLSNNITGLFCHGEYINTCEGMFGKCEKLCKIEIPKSVETIGNSAFKGCSSLESITIPHSVKEIGYSAFQSCSGLKSVAIPNSVKKIGSDAFCGCSGLKSVAIPNSVKEIGDSAFVGCSGLKSVAIPDSVERLHGGAFENCTSLTSVSCPEELLTIKQYSHKKIIGYVDPVPFANTPFWSQYSSNNNLCRQCGAPLPLFGFKCTYCARKKAYR